MLRDRADSELETAIKSDYDLFAKTINNPRPDQKAQDSQHP